MAFLQAKGISWHLSQDLLSSAYLMLRRKEILFLFDATNRFFIKQGIFFPSDQEVLNNLKRLLRRMIADHYRRAHRVKCDERSHNYLDDYEWSAIEDLETSNPFSEAISSESKAQAIELVSIIYGPFYDQADARDRAILNAMRKSELSKPKSNHIYDCLTSQERDLFLPSGKEPAVSAESSIKRAIYKRMLLLPTKIAQFFGDDFEPPIAA